MVSFLCSFAGMAFTVAFYLRYHLQGHKRNVEKEMKEISKKFIPLIMIFIFINAFIVIFNSFLWKHGFDDEFLLAANLLLFLLSVTGFFIQVKAIKSTNINAFLRGVYTSLILKIFIVMIVLGIYLFITGGKVNTPSLLTSMVLYLLYTTIEVKQLMKIYRTNPNG
jgi:hypothetical protein